MGQGSTLPHRMTDKLFLQTNINHKLMMTFELEMALDILNGQIDKGIEFPEAIDRALKMYPVSQES
jgi:hypothetical protein